MLGGLGVGTVTRVGVGAGVEVGVGVGVTDGVSEEGRVASTVD